MYLSFRYSISPSTVFKKLKINLNCFILNVRHPLHPVLNNDKKINVTISKEQGNRNGILFSLLVKIIIVTYMLEYGSLVLMLHIVVF